MRAVHLYSPSKAVAVALFATACFWPGPAQAALLISNLNGNDQNATTLVGNLDRSKALGFTLPAVGTYQFDSAILRLDVTDTTRTIAAGIYGSNAGVPSGSALITLTIPALNTGIRNYTLLPTSTFFLQPLTTYFLVAYGNSPGSSSNYIDWMGSSPVVTPTGVATYAGAYGDNSGTVTVPPTIASSTINSFAINATLIPEPTTMSMLALLVVGAGAVRRRRVN